MTPGYSVVCVAITVPFPFSRLVYDCDAAVETAKFANAVQFVVSDEVKSCAVIPEFATLFVSEEISTTAMPSNPCVSIEVLVWRMEAPVDSATGFARTIVRDTANESKPRPCPNTGSVKQKLTTARAINFKFLIFIFYLLNLSLSVVNYWFAASVLTQNEAA